MTKWQDIDKNEDRLLDRLTAIVSGPAGATAEKGGSASDAAWAGRGITAHVDDPGGQWARLEQVVPPAHLVGLLPIPVAGKKARYVADGMLAFDPSRATTAAVAAEIGRHVYYALASADLDRTLRRAYKGWQPHAILNQAPPANRVALFAEVYGTALLARLMADPTLWGGIKAEMPALATRIEDELFGGQVVG